MTSTSTWDGAPSRCVPAAMVMTEPVTEVGLTRAPLTQMR